MRCLSRALARAAPASTRIAPRPSCARPCDGQDPLASVYAEPGTRGVVVAACRGGEGGDGGANGVGGGICGGGGSDGGNPGGNGGTTGGRGRGGALGGDGGEKTLAASIAARSARSVSRVSAGSDAASRRLREQGALVAAGQSRPRAEGRLPRSRIGWRSSSLVNGATGAAARIGPFFTRPTTNYFAAQRGARTWRWPTLPPPSRRRRGCRRDKSI